MIRTRNVLRPRKKKKKKERKKRNSGGVVGESGQNNKPRLEAVVVDQREQHVRLERLP
jgi:hypothetical protein